MAQYRTSVTRSIFRFSTVFLWTSDFILSYFLQQDLVHRKLDHFSVNLNTILKLLEVVPLYQI